MIDHDLIVGQLPDDRDPAIVRAELLDRITRRACSLYVNEQGRRLLAEWTAPPPPPVDYGTVTEIMARPDEPAMRVDGLIPWHAATLIAAQRKTGKTTLALNLASCLIAGEPFLDRFDTRPLDLDASVGILNYEVTGRQIARWATDMGGLRDRLCVVNLRGNGNPLATEAGRASLAAVLTSHNVRALIIDPFGSAYTGESQNDAGEVRRWLDDTHAWATSLGVTDLVLTAHAGWNGERTRGSSALEDWADSIITLTRDDNTEDRYLRAMGRDVNVEEDLLDYDPGRRWLTLAGAGGRAQASQARRVADLAEAVVEAVTANPGMSGNRVHQALKEANVECRRADVLAALADAEKNGSLTFTTGPRNARLWQPATGSHRFPPVPEPLPELTGSHRFPPVPEPVTDLTGPPVPTGLYRNRWTGTSHSDQTEPEESPC